MYLFGTGATQAEIIHSGWPGNIVMSNINSKVHDESKTNNGEYAKLIEELSISPDDVDIEQFISLFEDFIESENKKFSKIMEEIKKYFHSSVIKNLLNKDGEYVPSNLSTALISLHKKYSRFMGENGEELLGILTVNFDSLLENALMKSHDGINYGIDIKYNEIIKLDKIPQLIKLHGSFNWRGVEQIEASPKYEKMDPDEKSRWLRPSVFKKPTSIYQELWKNASKLLLDCDILRVVGCSLRTEDWALISLIFQSQVESTKRFGIELILPDDSAESIRQRLPFLSRVKPIDEIYRTEFDKTNVFKSFVLRKFNEVAEKEQAVKNERELREMIE